MRAFPGAAVASRTGAGKFETAAPHHNFDTAAPAASAANSAPALAASASPSAPMPPSPMSSSPLLELNWARALPLTLTLDMEFDSITDRESFVGDVVEDVSAAAKIDARFVKVVGMRAGSVIVDMQIAPAAGDLDQIEQHLVEQVIPTGSALRRGKITSKTIKLVRTSSLAGPMAWSFGKSKEAEEHQADKPPALTFKIDPRPKDALAQVQVVGVFVSRVFVCVYYVCIDERDACKTKNHPCLRACHAACIEGTDLDG